MRTTMVIFGMWLLFESVASNAQEGPVTKILKSIDSLYAIDSDIYADVKCYTPENRSGNQAHVY